jgi:serine/threonine-protein kinase RsbT
VKDTDRGELPIQSEADIVIARRAVRDAATTLGFGITDVTRIVTAASELTRNVYLYAKSGTVRWRPLDVNGRVGLELVFEDHGPGIPDVTRAMEKGFSSSKGLGMGLPGAKRLMDEMSIESKLGKGTTVCVRKWLKRQHAGPTNH